MRNLVGRGCSPEADLKEEEEEDPASAVIAALRCLEVLTCSQRPAAVDGSPLA